MFVCKYAYTISKALFLALNLLLHALATDFIHELNIDNTTQQYIVIETKILNFDNTLKDTYQFSFYVYQSKSFFRLGATPTIRKQNTKTNALPIHKTRLYLTKTHYSKE